MFKFFLMSCIFCLSVQASAQDKIYICGQDAVCEDFSKVNLTKSQVYDIKTHELITGIVRELYDNGNIETEYTTKNGIYDGPTKGYYENGKLRGTGYFRLGKQDGLWQLYYENGTDRVSPSSRGLGHRVLIPATWVRIPLEMPYLPAYQNHQSPVLKNFANFICRFSKSAIFL